MKVRAPAVAGAFYEAEEHDLRERINSSFIHHLGPGKLPPAPEPDEKIFGFVLPHAGYVYSGPVAAHGYYLCSGIRDFELAVILGPNHWGIGSGVATYPGDYWRTPLGNLAIDKEAAKELVDSSGIVDYDETAHAREHSIEVHLPFLQFIKGNEIKILPVSMALQDIDTAVEIGNSLGSFLSKRRAILIASSDFTHYERHEVASRKDSEAIKAISELDVKQHYLTIQRMNISACGYGPIAAVITAVKALGARSGRLLKYATSGDTSGDFTSVVGYASIAFT